MEIPLLNDLVIILGLSIGVLLLCNRFRIPTIVGFLLTGILAGPHGFGLVKATHDVEILAEIGVVLLLFTIGMEFSFKTLFEIQKTALLGGSLQVVLSILATFAIVRSLGRPLGESLFVGFLVSLSSTAIVLKILQERAEIDSPQGRTSLGILVFQDMIAVPMMLLIPLLSGVRGNLGTSLLVLLGKGVGIIALVTLSAKWIVPTMLYQITRTRNRELFLLSVVVICFAVAWLTHAAGLSLALGAFLAGLILSESDYSYQALGDILPFRDLFTSLFFVSIGMLLDIRFFIHNLVPVSLVATIVVLLKIVTAGCATMMRGFPLRIAVLVGFTLAQIGEFSFILSRSGVTHGLLSQYMYQLFLASSVISMALTPFMITSAFPAAEVLARFPILERLKSGLFSADSPVPTVREDHLIVIGFGVNGRNLDRAAVMAGIPHTIIEMNPETVRREKEKGKPIFYGDATQKTVLTHAGIQEARVVVIAISDAAATRRIVDLVRRLNPKVHIIARTRFLSEVKPLYELGANEVIPEEFETSVEIFTRVLKKYLVPSDDIEKFISEVRSDGYQVFRSLSSDSRAFSDLNLALSDVEVTTVRVCEKSSAAGKSLAQIELRKKYHVSILAIYRDERVLSNPGAETVLLGNDILLALGAPDKIAVAMSLFRNEEKSSPCEAHPARTG